MLDNLTNRLNKVWRYLKGEVKITEATLQQALREIRLSLLEADVNFKVVKAFIESIRQKALGREVQESLNPYQQVIKIVSGELTAMLGSEKQDLPLAAIKPTVVMLAGLQGSGKTTTAGKLGLYLKNQGKSVLLAALDRKRLAAVQQLETIARETGLYFFDQPAAGVQELAESLLRTAREYGHDIVIADTAGRLHIDDELMEELRQVKALTKPTQTIFVADALTGQDAVNSALLFSQKIGIDSIILTKLDADSRGGAALSVVSVTGKPISFIGVGEKPADLQLFHPERLAQKILGMGDMLTLIEKAEREFDQKEAEKAAMRMLEDEFTMEDFGAQLAQVRKLGSLRDIADMLPRMGMAKSLDPAAIDESRIAHFLAIIRSMTPAERRNPKIIDGRRRQRIGRGSGRPVSEVNQLLKNFQEMRKTMKKPMFRRLLKKIDIFPKIM